MVQTNFNNLFNYVIAKETLNRKRCNPQYQYF